MTVRIGHQQRGPDRRRQPIEIEILGQRGAHGFLSQSDIVIAENTADVAFFTKAHASVHPNSAAGWGTAT